ncbi:hypothetical protein HGRIS_012472 [Hohenbuehelia grisea]|uniref:F-box domain-containing protein n=1 Tax=Hohenbuehelia grisea TaxID=104357 RepID=A0ABR3ISF1_9AGAR
MLTLPPELQREIFEWTATAYPSVAPKLLRVAQKTRLWLEPVIYRVVVLDSPMITISLFMRTLESKPPSFFAAHVKTLCLTANTVTLQQAQRLLSICSGLENLICWAGANSANLSSYISSKKLRRLSAKMEVLFPEDPTMDDIRHPMFKALTHLDIVNPLEPPSLQHWDGLSALQNLTHLALGDLFYWSPQAVSTTITYILDRCENLQALIVVCGSKPQRERLALEHKDNTKLHLLPSFHHPQDYPVYMGEIRQRGDQGVWMNADREILVK